MYSFDVYIRLGWGGKPLLLYSVEAASGSRRGEANLSVVGLVNQTARLRKQ